MILCPNCQHKEVPGTVFCSNCATQLIEPSANKTHEIHDPGANLRTLRTSPYRPTPQVHFNSWASLHILESGQIISLADRNEFTLGRTSEGQPIMPDVDLTDFNAYVYGVSRLHCVIKKENLIAFVMDLGSSNGTYLNGIRLSAHVQTQINHGDVISLGKLKIQILINQTVGE